MLRRADLFHGSKIWCQEIWRSVCSCACMHYSGGCLTAQESRQKCQRALQYPVVGTHGPSSCLNSPSFAESERENHHSVNDSAAEPLCKAKISWSRKATTLQNHMCTVDGSKQGFTDSMHSQVLIAQESGNAEWTCALHCRKIPDFKPFDTMNFCRRVIKVKLCGPVPW